jgi:hypothetical protein
MKPKRASHEKLYALIKGAPSPQTLTQLLGRQPKVAEAEAASRLLESGWVTRDMQGRYAVSNEPPPDGGSGGGEAGHGIFVEDPSPKRHAKARNQLRQWGSD